MFFFAAVNNNNSDNQRKLKNRNEQNGSKSTNHRLLFPERYAYTIDGGEESKHEGSSSVKERRSKVLDLCFHVCFNTITG